MQSTSLLKSVLNQYLSGHQVPSVWWLKDSSTDQLGKVAEQIAIRQALIGRTLKRYRYTSPLTKKIADKFSNFVVTLVQNGHTVSVTPGHSSEFASRIERGDLEICFVPQTEKDQHPSSLYYREEWEAVSIYGIDWPEKVFPGLLYHEMGHGLASKEGWASASASPGSEAYIREEVQMHALEDQIMNLASGGSYHAALDKIIQRVRPKGWQEAVQGLTLADLRTLDTVLGCSKAGSEIASIICAQYMLSLGMWYIETGPKPQDKTQEQIVLYSYLTETF